MASITVEEGNNTYDSRNNCNAIIETATNKLIVGCHSTVIPDNVTTIGNKAFIGSHLLTSITIPESVTMIEAEAFWGCMSLTSITIPNNVASIGSEVFSGCNDLASITVEEGNNTYDSRNNCNAIIETATNKLIVGCQSTVIPENVTTIGYKAFKGCSFKLTSITIPESVTMIEAEAFWDCLELSIIYVRAKNPPILNMSDDWRYPFYYPSITKIYVPQESLETYHYDEGWSNYWDKIEGYNFE